MVIPSGFSQVNIKLTGAALPLGAEVTFGVTNLIGDSPAQVAAKVITSGTSALIKNLIATEATLGSVLVKNGPNATGPMAEVAWNLAGNLSSGAGNPSSALLVRKLTDHGGRHGSGRTYWPALPEAYILPGGAVDGALVTAAQTIVNNFLTALGTNDHAMYLLHGDATAPYLVTSLQVESRVGNQRRRNRK